MRKYKISLLKHKRFRQKYEVSKIKTNIIQLNQLLTVEKNAWLHKLKFINYNAITKLMIFELSS